jgi:hypothetical protein
MNDPEKPAEGATVSCTVCLKEIPHDQATRKEFEDLVRYFCGLDCYRQWQQEEDAAAEE